MKYYLLQNESNKVIVNLNESSQQKEINLAYMEALKNQWI